MSTFNRANCFKILNLFKVNNSLFEIADFLGSFPFPSIARGTWGFYAAKLVRWIECIIEFDQYLPNIPFTVFKKGNSKLPFYSFSALPHLTCPGMGACAAFCYSLKAWRYPAAFFRMVQNTILVKYSLASLMFCWRQLLQSITVRLYVDGDFDSIETLRFWMDACHARPDLKVYGYSKSWELFLALADEGYEFPVNYKLNLSSGSKYDETTRDRMSQLPITRGVFDAVPNARAEQKLRKSNGRRAFVCPGNCGDCIKPTANDPTGHACGSDRFKDVDILIDIH